MATFSSAVGAIEDSEKQPYMNLITLDGTEMIPVIDDVRRHEVEVVAERNRNPCVCCIMDDTQQSFCTFIPVPAFEGRKNEPDFTWQCVQCASKKIECFQIRKELRGKALEVADEHWDDNESWGNYRADLQELIEMNCPTGDWASSFRLHVGNPGRGENDYDTTGPRSKDFRPSSEQVELAKLKRKWNRMQTGFVDDAHTRLLDKIQDMQDQLALERRARQNEP
ncbi:hypothetical protein BDZ85DRAFT_282083 [Elsinoe ampelina]|uniref:Uncharacterized protein n=1 Tax=Elsinoe ampelina TaxID=302913 RepID=A0A6A6GBD6_9PEZI|nr:hypothetical protein BDZ85DRAFT_282083 [Elsinoe ampelina]